MFTVTSSSCTAPAPVTMNATQIAALEGSTVAGTAGSGVGAAVFGIPAALGALGVAAAASDDDNDGTAASPG
ncbi:MAG TPA: hypothetical protein EYQ28_05395 [Henriciella sp.]|nr:hypothetical protein [Henriciella sp.]